jgi:adenylate kinase
VFHIEFDPPKDEGVCDICGARLEIRDDDKPEVVRHRLGTYHEKTEPLVAHYEERGFLYRIDGLPAPDEVGARIRALFATLRKEEEL